MKIKFLQKTTLVDYAGEIACTLFTFGCNFKCGFCYNPELVLEEKSPDISPDEILKFLEHRKKYLSAICITGGEPLINIDIEFLEKIKSIGYKIKIDTNGSFPERLKEIIDKKLVDFVSMDVKTKKQNYLNITNSTIEIEKIEESMKLISQLENYEFRTTIVPSLHKKEDIIEMLVWLNEIINKKPKLFTLQGFKNKHKFVDESFQNEKDATESFLQEIKAELLNNQLSERIEVKI